MFRKTLIAALTVATVAGAAIIAPTAASAGYFGYHQSYGHDHGHRKSYCFQKAITKYDYYTGRVVVVGYTTVCH